MPQRTAKLTVGLLAVRDSTASTLYGMYEILESAGRDWALVAEGRSAESAIEPRVVSATGQSFRAPNGLMIEPQASLADYGVPDVVAIPDLMVLPDDDIAGRYDAEIEWLRACYAAGAALAAACTGALILAEAGLLDGEDATTHWAYSDAMRTRYPKTRVHANRALVTSGEEQRLILAGGGTSWHDLALFVIARYVGAEEAVRVAKLHLIDWHHVGQQPFATFMKSRQVADSAIARCQTWIAEHYEVDSPVSAMVKLSGLAERSFKRRFAQATGMSPIEYVHSLRLEESKHLLERSDLPVEAIANQVGYEDASFFGRLFRRKVGLTPAQYRRRFGRARELVGSVDLSTAQKPQRGRGAGAPH